MKKILLCYHSAEFGGVEKHILDIISGLSKNFEVYVACPKGPLVEDYLRAGAKRHIDLYPRFEADFIYVRRMVSLIKTEKIEIVHAHELLTGSLATFAGWIAGCDKRIYHVHTSFTQWRYSRLKRYPALFINTLVNFIVGNFFATDVIALTESVKQIRVRKEFINKNKIRVIPNGIYLEQFSREKSDRDAFREELGLSDREFVIGNIARFTREKGHIVLLEAFKSIVANNSTRNFILVLAGTGIMQTELQSIIQKANLNNKVHFLGNFKEADKSKILSAFDCFVFPSYAEGFGIAIVEAMAMGVPVVASDLDVLQDVGGNAITYFETGNSKDLETKISDMSQKSYLEIARAEREQANNYSMEKFWQAYTNLYNS